MSARHTLTPGRILAMLNERAPVFSQTEDATIYLAAKTVLGGLAPVDLACREWAVAMQRLGGASLLDAVEVFKKIGPLSPCRTIISPNNNQSVPCLFVPTVSKIS